MMAFDDCDHPVESHLPLQFVQLSRAKSSISLSEALAFARLRPANWSIVFLSQGWVIWSVL
jgi:hypothetical protein